MLGRNAFFFLAFCSLSGAAAAEPVTSNEFQRDVADYPCSTTMKTSSGRQFVVQLSDYKDVWSLNFFFSGDPTVLRTFFDQRGLRDDDLLAEAVPEIGIGSTALAPDDATLFATQVSEVDASTSAMFKIETLHRVSQALAGMKSDGLRFGSLESFTDTDFTEFRACAQEAMGLGADEVVGIDMREEYRLAFEKLFESWAEHAALADSCMVAPLDEGRRSSYIDRAAAAFYPGLTNMFRRDEYRSSLESSATFAQLAGRTAAISDGCLMAAQLADLSERAVLDVLERAEALD